MAFGLTSSEYPYCIYKPWLNVNKVKIRLAVISQISILVALFKIEKGKFIQKSPEFESYNRNVPNRIHSNFPPTRTTKFLLKLVVQ